MRMIALFFVAITSASAQYDLFDLATNGDGSAAYFSSKLALAGSGETSSAGRIFRVSSERFQLYLERPEIQLPPVTGIYWSPIQFSNYFDLSRPQASDDGRVVAVVARRTCRGSNGCPQAPSLQTIVTGLPTGTLEVSGAGILSRNGQSLLVHGDGTGDSCVHVVSLRAETSDRPRECLPFPSHYSSGHFAIADNGTVALAANGLRLIGSTGVTEIRDLPGTAAEPAIDSAGKLVVLTVSHPVNFRRSLHVVNLVDGRHQALGTPGEADSHSPSLSADGQRVLYLSDVSGQPQAYIMPTSGGPPRQITNDRSGVIGAVLSGDGKVAWYFSGEARLYQVHLDTGEVLERLGRTPQIREVTGAVAGSISTIAGSGLSDGVYTAQSFPLPRSLGGVSVTVNGVESPLFSVSPTQIQFQVPSQMAPGAEAEVKTTASSSPFVARLRFAAETVFGRGRFLLNPQSPAYGGAFNVYAVHEDWSALVTYSAPAASGEIVHVYGANLGPLDAPKPLDGSPAPTNPAARTIHPITCHADVFAGLNYLRFPMPVHFSGLAPGLVGIYQLDVQVPQNTYRVSSLPIDCYSAVLSGLVSGALPIKP